MLHALGGAGPPWGWRTYQFSWEWEQKGCPASALHYSCKISFPPPQRCKVSPSQRGSETASTCSIAPSDHLCHCSAARRNAVISNAWERGTD